MHKYLIKSSSVQKYLFIEIIINKFIKQTIWHSNIATQNKSWNSILIELFNIEFVGLQYTFIKKIV